MSDGHALHVQASSCFTTRTQHVLHVHRSMVRQVSILVSKGQLTCLHLAKKRRLRRRRSRRRSLAFLTLCREDARAGSYSRLLLLNKCDSDFQPFRYSVRFPKTLSPFLQLHFYSKALTWIWVRINILRAAKVEFHIFTTWKFQIPSMSA